MLSLMLSLTENHNKRIEVYTPYLTVPSAQYTEYTYRVLVSQQMQYLEIKYLVYDLPIQKVLRHPVDITHFFSVLAGYCRGEMWL